MNHEVLAAYLFSPELSAEERLERIKTAFEAFDPQLVSVLLNSLLWLNREQRRFFEDNYINKSWKTFIGAELAAYLDVYAHHDQS